MRQISSSKDSELEHRSSQKVKEKVSDVSASAYQYAEVLEG